MLSKNINQQKSQLTLDFDAGLTERYQSLREVIATGVYQRGIGRIAIDLDQAPGNLSVQLSDDPLRHFSVESLERYIEKTGDVTPVYYLVEKFLQDDEMRQRRALNELAKQLPDILALFKSATSHGKGGA